MRVVEPKPMAKRRRRRLKMRCMEKRCKKHEYAWEKVLQNQRSWKEVPKKKAKSDESSG